MKQPSKQELRDRIAELEMEVARLRNELAVALSNTTVTGAPASITVN
jgi:ribosomal protein L29